LERAVTNWQPPADLTRLLEALASEISSSTDSEIMIARVDSVGDVQGAPRIARTLVVRIRELIEAAMDEPEPRDTQRQALVVEGEGACELRNRPH
jgi:hypothetical protein